MRRHMICQRLAKGGLLGLFLYTPKYTRIIAHTAALVLRYCSAAAAAGSSGVRSGLNAPLK